MPEPFDAPVRPLDPILTRSTRAASAQAERAVAPAVAQDGRSHGFQESNPPNSAVAAPAAPDAARAGPNHVGVEPYGEPKLQYFRVGQPRIGHMRLDHAGAGEFGARAGTAGNGLVILILRVAESEIIHGALARRHHPQGAEECLT